MLLLFCFFTLTFKNENYVLCVCLCVFCLFVCLFVVVVVVFFVCLFSVLFLFWGFYGFVFVCLFLLLLLLLFLFIYLFFYFIDFFIRKPGLYPVQVDVTGAFDKTFTSRQMINVEQEIYSWLTCPEYAVRGVDFECQIVVRKGSNMTLSIASFPGK